jgi:hypothetical protein
LIHDIFFIKAAADKKWVERVTEFGKFKTPEVIDGKLSKWRIGEPSKTIGQTPGSAKPEAKLEAMRNPEEDMRPGVLQEELTSMLGPGLMFEVLRFV